MYGKFFVFCGAVCPADGTQTKHGKTVTLGHKKWAPRGLYPDNMSRLYHKRRGTAIRIPPRLRAMGAAISRLKMAARCMCSHNSIRKQGGHSGDGVAVGLGDHPRSPAVGVMADDVPGGKWACPPGSPLTGAYTAGAPSGAPPPAFSWPGPGGASRCWGRCPCVLRSPGWSTLGRPAWR